MSEGAAERPPTGRVVTRAALVESLGERHTETEIETEIETETETNGRERPTETEREAIFVLKDRFGFFLTDEFHMEVALSPEEARLRKDKESERSRKWVRMLKSWKRFFKTESLALPASQSVSQVDSQSLDLGGAEKGTVAETSASSPSLSSPSPSPSQSTSASSSKKLKSRVRKGVPDDVRGYVWFEFARTRGAKLQIPNPYEIDTNALNQVTVEEIERDVDRTFPRHAMFVENNGVGQASLRRLLQWYAVLDPEVGYCQGMGFIAGLFLTYMIEEQAFYAFYSVLQRPSAPLRLLYLPRLTETQKILTVFEKLCNLHLGKLWLHMSTQGMHPTMFFTEWVMCIFSRGFSFELVTRVWDVFLHEGDMKIVYRVSLAILKCFETEIMELRFEKIMNFMRHIANRVDAKVVMETAWKIPLKRAQIKKFEDEHNEEVRLAEEKRKAKN